MYFKVTTGRYDIYVDNNQILKKVEDDEASMLWSGGFSVE